MFPAAKVKLVYLNGTPIGSAIAWNDASLVLSVSLDRNVTVAETLERGIEGPDGFYVWMPPVIQP
jgi:hypothetical protein